MQVACPGFGHASLRRTLADGWRVLVAGALRRGLGRPALLAQHTLADYLPELAATLSALAGTRVECPVPGFDPHEPARTLHVVGRAFFEREGAVVESILELRFARAELTLETAEFAYDEMEAALDHLTRLMTMTLFAGREAWLTRGFAAPDLASPRPDGEAPAPGAGIAEAEDPLPLDLPRRLSA